MKTPASRHCGKCGEELQNVRPHGEQFLVGTHDGKIRGSSREFLGECPEHDTVFAVSHIGHHSTYLEAKLKRRYPKSVRQSIKSKLTKDQWKKFDKALHGWCQPSDGEQVLWDYLAGNSHLSESTVSLGFPTLRLQVSRGSESLKRNLLLGGAAITITGSHSNSTIS